MILDGAKVLLLSSKDYFGEIAYSDNSLPPIIVQYLAICMYENDNQVFLFLCDEQMEVEQDCCFDTLEEAIQDGYRRNKDIVWNEV